MRRVRYNSKLHPPWSHRRNVRGSLMLMGNYAIPMHRLKRVWPELIGKKYSDYCNQCGPDTVCSCKLAELIAPNVYYIHYADDGYVRNRYNDIHVFVDPISNIIKYVGAVPGDYSI